VVFDSDAAAFFTRAGITDTTQKGAVNALVLSAKADGWWTNCDALYPFVGGTSNTHNLNLKGNYDNITWQGYLTNAAAHTANGVTSDGSAGTYGGIPFTPTTATNYSRYSAHLFVYCGSTAYPASITCPLGVGDTYYQEIIFLNFGGANYELVSCGLNNNGNYSGKNDYVNLVNSAADMRGPSIISRTADNSQSCWLRGIQSPVYTGVTTGMDNEHFFVFALNSGGTSYYNCAVNLRGVSIGGGIDSPTWAKMSAAWDTFNAALGRKVP
jgi:hypothetical protein